MAKNPVNHGAHQLQDFEGLVNNLQDWELAFKDKNKKMTQHSQGKQKLDVPSERLSVSNASELSTSSEINRRKTVQASTPAAGSSKWLDYLGNPISVNNLSADLMTEDSPIDANSEKELGNEFYKQKKYNEAIDCYSRSIVFSPTAVAYANRAMAYLKVRRFQEAENDCSEALNLDDRYLKAYSRRSTARRELGKLKQSFEDAEFALRLEPQNQELKKQYAEVKTLIEKEVLKKTSGLVSASGQGAQTSRSSKGESVKLGNGMTASDRSKKVTGVEEGPSKGDDRETPVSMDIDSQNLRHSGLDVNASGADAMQNLVPKSVKKNHKNAKQKLKESVQELAARAATLASAEAAKNITAPNSAYQFEVSWRALSGDRNLQARLLKVTPPTALPRIIKNALSAALLVDIIRCVASFFTEDVDLAVQYLECITKIPRFDMIIMCLSANDKADLLKAWNDVFSAAPTDYAHLLGNLRLRYGLKQ